MPLFVFPGCWCNHCRMIYHGLVFTVFILTNWIKKICSNSLWIIYLQMDNFLMIYLIVHTKQGGFKLSPPAVLHPIPILCHSCLISSYYTVLCGSWLTFNIEMAFSVYDKMNNCCCMLCCFILFGCNYLVKNGFLFFYFWVIVTILGLSFILL